MKPADGLILATASLAAAAAGWPDTPIGRAEALAVLQGFNAELLSHDSATLVLDRWCARHRIAAPATIVADRVRGEDKPAGPDIRALLKVGPDEAVAYRRVRLRCGPVVLSDADNWYVPGRLTPEMNRTLETSDVSFGRAVQPLGFRRHTLSAKLLWHPLPEDWDAGAGTLHLGGGKGASLAIPDHVLEHRALLALPDGTPFSALTETYTAQVLAFGPPRLAR